MRTGSKRANNQPLIIQGCQDYYLRMAFGMAHLPDAIYADPRYLNLQQENIKRCILCDVEGVGGGPSAGNYGEICRGLKSPGIALSETCFAL